MKVVQSYIQHLEPNSFKVEIDYAYIIMLNSLLLKKHYGGSTLYTNEITFRHFSKIGFPLEYNIDVVNEYHSKIFSLSKFATIEHQTEPFIHCDLDTFILKKPNLDVKNSPYVFSHPDVKFLHDKIKEDDNYTSRVLSDEHFDLYDTYLRNYYLLKDTLQQDKFDWPGKGYINFQDIPNMNFIAVKKELDTVKDAIHKALVIVDETHLHQNKQWSDAHFVEQFCFPILLKKYNPSFNDLCDENSINEFNYKKSQFLLSSNPILDIPYVDTTKRIENGTFDELFPMKFEINQYCTECNQNHNIFHEIETPKELADNLNLDFLGFYHFGGGNKKIPILQAMIIGHIIKHFGEEYVMKVHNYFKNEIYTQQGLTNQISNGEYLYEHLTGNKIFTSPPKSVII